MPPLVLASGSPRRAEVLRTLGIAFEVDVSSLPETVLPGEDPVRHARRLAVEKAVSVSLRHPGALVLGGDTVVLLDGDILGKPRDAADAVSMLLRLAGRSHSVASGLALARDGREVSSGVEVTRVDFRPFDREVAERYVATGEPLDKAGAYGIQEMGAALVQRVEGDYTGVVGLPVSLLLSLLDRAGVPYAFPASSAPESGVRA
jgi:septum formation protein